MNLFSSFNYFLLQQTLRKLFLLFFGTADDAVKVIKRWLDSMKIIVNIESCILRNIKHV